jgi:hypothetical protein
MAAREARIREIIAHIAGHPDVAPRVEERSGVHVVPLVRYPYKGVGYSVPHRLATLHRFYSICS